MHSAPPRMGITLPVLAVMVCDIAFGLGRAFAEPQPPKPILHPIPEGAVFERHLVGGPEDTNVAGSSVERLIYSNTLGTFGVRLGAGNLVSDDIATTVPNGCKLRRYEFPVVGKVDPAGIGGPYTVDFALYRSCPGSVSVASRPGLIIPGTQGQSRFLDDVPRLISFVAGPNVSLQTNMWLGVRFSRGNAGVVVGAPALVGFSADSYDYPGFPCNADFGGFPDQPHASFNAEIYADAGCSEAFIGYKNSNPSGSVYNPGANITFADDIHLGVNECQMIAYEVAVKGVGYYTFDMRLTCEGPAIPGTEQSFSVGSGTEARILRFIVNPPVPLPQNLWFSAKVSNATTGQVVIAGQQACIGSTENLIESVGPNGCDIVPPDIIGTGVHAAFSLTITCAGAPPVGACCDMAILDENGDAVCREVPQMNCPWPPRFSTLQPAWVPGATCGADPFPHPCGQAACCFVDQQGSKCVNLTRTQCERDLTRPPQWQRGRYCNEFGQHCAHPDCLRRTGECTLPRCQSGARACAGGANDGQPCLSSAHCPNGRCAPCSALNCHVSPTCCDSCPPVGCEDNECCTRVCNYFSDGPYCCEVEWDDVCALLAREFCRCPGNGGIDVDGDGDSDLNDYAGFPGCMDGPNVSVDPNCRVYDLDRDADIDLFDYSLLQIGLGCTPSK
ncbi:MAG: hypothetical protein V1790_15015 [Planctomycetota bacterium]